MTLVLSETEAAGLYAVLNHEHETPVYVLRGQNSATGIYNVLESLEQALRGAEII